MIDNQAFGAGAQLAPQGLFGSILGAPLGGLIGGGIGGLFGNAKLGRQIGQGVGGIGGAFLPLGADPVAQAQQQQQMDLLQQAQLAQGLAPQSTFGRPINFGKLGGPLTGLFGDPRFNFQKPVFAGTNPLLPFSADPAALAQQQMAQLQQAQAGAQLATQGFLGGLLGAPLGGMIGGGIGHLLGNAKLGRQIGQAAGGIGGAFLPLAADPVAEAQQQQQIQQLQQMQQMQQAQQLAPQGFFGDIINKVGAPLGGAVGGLFGHAGLGRTIGGVAGRLGGLLPFDADPVTQAQAQQLQQMQQAQLAQQGQLAPQGFFGDIINTVGAPLGGAVGGLFGNAGLGRTIGGVAGRLGGLLPFEADPVAQAQAQQLQQAQLAELAQQGQLSPLGGRIGNFISQVGRPVGSAVGGLFGHAGMGGTIGGIAGQIGSLLPFDADPVAQAQLAALAQAGQLSPQGGTIGNFIGQIGRPVGGAIGGLFGQAGLGRAIGGVAGRLGSLLPFDADPLAQQMQQAQQMQMLQLQQAQLQQLQQMQQMQQMQQAQLAQQAGAQYSGEQTVH